MSKNRETSYNAALTYELLKNSGFNVTLTKETQNKIVSQQSAPKKEKKISNNNVSPKINPAITKDEKKQSKKPSKKKEKIRGAGTNVIASINNTQSKPDSVKQRVAQSKTSADKYRKSSPPKTNTGDIIKQFEAEDSAPALCIESKPTIPSEITRVNIEHGMLHKTVIIVDDVEHQNAANNIYWKDRTTSKSILRAIINNKSLVFHDDRKWHMISYTKTPLLSKQLQVSNYLSTNRSYVTVWIYKSKTPCPQHPHAVESITAYVPSIRHSEAKPININYCSICNKYYINSTQFNAYAKQYGMPLIRLQTCSSGDPNDFTTWNDESILHFVGYNVGSTDSISDSRRQEILREAIEANIISKAQAIHFIENMINMHEYQSTMANAVYKWEKDLKYLQNYKIHTQKQVLAKFKLNNY